MSKAYLVLENGSVFEGESFGAPAKNAMGELVFTTGVCGYGETLTDPAYFGQIILQTFPLIGNYGVIGEDLKNKCCAAGYVVREWCETPSNFRSEKTIDEYLKEQGIPGICGVDTREITKIIRDNGVMNAMICDEVPHDLAALKNFKISGGVQPCEKKALPAEGEKKFTLAMMDLGAKMNLADQFAERGCEIHIFPCDATPEELLACKPDGLIITGGPGDPAENKETIETLKALLGKIPMMGVGLGHQEMALAAGGETFKLKYGHRGGNQPVKDLESGRTYITAQNHGYAVNGETLPKGKVRYINANDLTCEGVDYPEWNAFSLQFCPESCIGPQDTSFLFDRFIAMMGGK